MKKIIIITNHSYMLWQFRRELISSLIAYGNQVIIVLPFGEKTEELRALGCRLLDTPMNRRGTNPMQELKLLREYRRILKAEKPDLVLTYSVKPNLYGGILCAVMGIARCMHVQGTGTAFQKPLLRSFVTVLYRVAARGAKVVFFENEDNARLFREKRIIRPDQQRILPGAGVNLEYFSAAEYPQGDRVHFLFLGRLMQEKGIRELLDALEQLYREGEQFHLDILGFQEEQWQREVERLKKLGICTHHGFQLDPRPFYKKAHCVVLPSYHEGMSNVLLEAGATARPVITSNIPGCREAVEEGITGYLCESRNTEALKEKLRQFLHLPRDAARQMGLCARKKMESEFDRNQVVALTIAAIMREE